MNNVWAGWDLGTWASQISALQQSEEQRSNMQQDCQNVHMTKCNAAAWALALNDYRHQASVMLRILAPS